MPEEKMLIIVCGAENSGNRMWTKFLVEHCGFLGDWGEEGEISQATKGWWYEDGRNGLRPEEVSEGATGVVINHSWPQGPLGNGPSREELVNLGRREEDIDTLLVPGKGGKHWYFPLPTLAANVACEYGWKRIRVLLCVRDQNIVQHYMAEHRRGGGDEGARSAEKSVEHSRMIAHALTYSVGKSGLPLMALVASMECAQWLGFSYATWLFAQWGITPTHGFEWKNTNKAWMK